MIENTSKGHWFRWKESLVPMEETCPDTQHRDDEKRQMTKSANCRVIEDIPGNEKEA